MNAPDDVYVERKGWIERVVGRLFEGEEAVPYVIERIVAPLGLRVDESSPWVDARLPDASRVQTNFLSTPFSVIGEGLSRRRSRSRAPAFTDVPRAIRAEGQAC